MLILDVGSLLICLSIVPDIFVNTWILHRFYLTYFKFHPSLPKMSQLWCIFPSQPVPLVSLKQDVWRSAGDESKEICIIGKGVVELLQPALTVSTTYRARSLSICLCHCCCHHLCCCTNLIFCYFPWARWCH
jgi:hypothetical protein